MTKPRHTSSIMNSFIARWLRFWVITLPVLVPQPCWLQNVEDTTHRVEFSVSSSSSVSHEVTEPSALLPKENSDDASNITREALSQAASEQEPVVFIEDSSAPGYLSLPSLQTRQATAVSAASAPSATALDWQHPIEAWERDYRRFRWNNTRVQHIEAECQDDYMKIRIGFNGTFTGLVYSAGYAYDPDCMYINGTGRDYYEFYIQLNRCGTLGKNTHNEDNRKSPTKNFMWNTVTVQYNPLIEEEFDEHFKVTCEYGYDFWKTVTFPFLDVEVATGNPVVFTLTPPECYMEIRYGYGVSGNRVTGPVRVGDPLTLIIYMRSKYDGFDIVVNDCYAHNGATKKIQLIDEYGCPVDDKLISRFRGSWSDSGVYETQVFAYMKTFRFTGSPALYIECDVRMCHGRCPSQACHWRNVKTVKKRSIDQLNSTKTPSLSENLSLFQSLRVLQEGEDDQSENVTSTATLVSNPNNVCLKAGWFSALLAIGAGMMCLLGGALLATCSRMRKLAVDKMLPAEQFDTYVNHKGRIN
ncbi:uncharacterized protein LOC108736926 [Agrilus planipennis]|uniref:Uncharacterized protein LOC108736926 n=1 Tax=Agrilus planipennis TaxID=224129 RepID=A0A1W4WWZ3_AGRPL|nr:uncharacterized protein LOC108736926 [Agrilus planipennis]